MEASGPQRTWAYPARPELLAEDIGESGSPVFRRRQAQASIVETWRVACFVSGQRTQQSRAMRLGLWPAWLGGYVMTVEGPERPDRRAASNRRGLLAKPQGHEA